MDFKRHTGQKRQSRRAAAVVELAVCLPLLFTIFFGSIEACNVIFLKQAVTAAAYTRNWTAAIHAWLHHHTIVPCPLLASIPISNLADDERFQKSHADHDPGEVVVCDHS